MNDAELRGKMKDESGLGVLSFVFVIIAVTTAVMLWLMR
jgi:hypothetical protein